MKVYFIDSLVSIAYTCVLKRSCEFLYMRMYVYEGACMSLLVKYVPVCLSL